MIYNWNQALKLGVFNDAIQIVLQDKMGVVHQGHIDLITYGKTLGKVVVVVQEDYAQQGGFFSTGTVPVVDKINTKAEVDSINDLDVDVVIKPKLILSEEEREILFLYAMAIVKPYEKELLIARKINMCRYMAMIRMHRILNKNPQPHANFKHIVVGVEVTYFFEKAAYKDSGERYPDNLVLFPIVKDEYGLKLGSRNRIMFDEEYAALPDLKKSLGPYLKDIKPGLNEDVIKQMNSDVKSEVWSTEYAVRYTGGIFGKDILDYFSFKFPKSNICVEDFDYIKGE